MIYLSIVEAAEERSLFMHIYYTYRKQSFFVAKSILLDDFWAEDAVQETFIRIAKQIRVCRRLTEEQLKVYVLTAARNAALDIYRRERRLREGRVIFDEENMGPSRDPAFDAQMTSEARRIVTGVISRLPSSQRDVLTLWYVHDLTCEQIAVVLGKKSSAVYKALWRARRALREGCKKEGLEIEIE